MRKVLSIVLALLMVSMMIPSMAFAETAITASSVTGLVAGETFNITANVGSAMEVTLEVNAQLFNIDGVTADSNNIAATTATADENGDVTFAVNVNDEIPADIESNVRITAGGTSALVKMVIDDRYLGDVSGDNEVTVLDAGLIAAYKANPASITDSIIKPVVGDVNSDNEITVLDAGLIAAFKADPTSISIVGIGSVCVGSLAGEIDPSTITDPFATPSTPDPVELDKVSGITAVYTVDATTSAITVYYQFNTVVNASSYQVYVNGVAVDGATATTGSFVAPANWNAEGTNVLTVKAIGDGTTYTDSTSDEITITLNETSTALAEWLKANGLEDVVITVYEITAE